MSEIATNRKARRDYEIVDHLEAGIELKGTEVKSVRQGKINLRDAFARVDRNQVFLYGCDIQPYEHASFSQHDAKRPRRLLLTRKEINRLKGLVEQRGLSLVALSAYWKGRRVKISLGVGRGKTKGDKREDIKNRVENREAQRAMAHYNRK